MNSFVVTCWKRYDKLGKYQHKYELEILRSQDWFLKILVSVKTRLGDASIGGLMEIYM